MEDSDIVKRNYVQFCKIIIFIIKSEHNYYKLGDLNFE